MKFGKVDNPEEVDFTLPQDHKETTGIISNYPHKTNETEVFVGCAKWNRAELKNFYPRGTKDELTYYSSQFNCIELNASFYRIFPPEQFTKWREKTPDNFKFFPKVNQEISHWKRLKDTQQVVEQYCFSAEKLEEKLGTCFLQMNSNFSTKDFERIAPFCEQWPKHIPLAIEFRHTDWYNDEHIANELYAILEENNIANIITDTAGRRDLLHMRLTNSNAFIRYVGSNHISDYQRLDDWITRLKYWQELDINEINFFVHQNLEVESPLLASYFTKQLNKELGTNLHVAKTLNELPPTLF